MRHSLLVITAASLGLFASLSPAVAASDPSAMFLDAYMNANQAQKLEGEGRPKAALEKYRYAGTLLDQLHAAHPQWQTLIVKHRKERTADSIARIEGQLAAENALINESVPPQGLALDTTILPGFNDGETPGKTADLPLPGPTPASDPFRDQVKELTSELEKVRGSLDQANRERERLSEALAKAQQEKVATPAPGVSDDELAALKRDLEAAQAEAAVVRKQLDKAQMNEADLQIELESAISSSNAQSGKEIAKLRSQLDEAKAEREIAEEQGTLLAKKVSELSKRPDLTTKLAEVEAKNEKLAGDLAAAQEQVKELSAAEKRLQAQNAKLNEELVSIGKKSENQAAEIAAAEQKLIAMTLERDKAVSDLATAKKERGDLDKVLAENAELAKKLDEAQKRMASMSTSAPEKQKEIEALKEKLVALNAQLEEAHKEGIANKKQVEELQAQLKASTEAGALGVTPEEQKKLTEENALLRGIVMRELKDQARREQAKKMITAELKRLRVRSESLNEQVALLSQPVAPLTDKEKALLKTPQMEILDDGGDFLSISIVAPQAGGPTKKEDRGQSVLLPDAMAGEGARATPGKPQVDTKQRPNLPEALQPMVKEARDRFERGEFKEAAKVYEKLLSRAPKSVYVLSNLGVAYFQAGNQKQAEETLKKVIALSPEDAFSHTTLGIIYFHQKKFDDAVTALTRSLSLNPRDPKAHNYLGVTAAEKGWIEAALKELETAIQLDSNYADAHFNLAVVLATASSPDIERARNHYDKAISLGASSDTSLESILY